MLRQRSQDTALAAAELRSSTLLSHTFAAWLEAVASASVEGSLREERLRLGLRFADRRRCAAVLHVWLHRVRCRSRLQLLGHQLAAGVRLSRLSSLFSTWRDAAGTAAFNEQFCVVQQRRVAFMGWRTAAAGCRAVGRGCIPSHHNRPPAGGGSTGLATEHRRCVTLSSSLQGWISALQVGSDPPAAALRTPSPMAFWV
ncbi:MAG: hypothetical protein WDW38_008349 [Sanguina aurantia]